MHTRQDNPFLTKIVFEPQFVENDLFGVVTDIDPIVPEHYMLYTKLYQPSLADCDTAAMTSFIETDFLTKVSKPYAYFERGRASFCTSMNGVQHGHGHLVPAFTEEMEHLFPYGIVECYDSLQEAYCHIQTQGQYLLWGNLGNKFYVLQNVEALPKRTIRNTIKEFF